MSRGVFRLRPVPLWVRTTLAAVAGAVVAVWVAGSVAAPIGPFDATLSARPGLSGQTTVRLGPLGTIGLDTHDAPVAVEVRVDDLRVAAAERIASDPGSLATLEHDVARDVRDALRMLALRLLVVAMAGAALGALTVTATWRSVARGLAVGVLLVVSSGTATVATFDGDSFAEPRYTGLMTVAPTAVGDVETILARFDDYRAQLAELVTNVVSLYRAAERLPDIDPGENAIRVLHVSDIHLNPQAYDLIALLVRQFDVDAVVDSGDVTDWGSDPETRVLDAIGRLGVPYVWVRGNHDSAATQRAIAAQRNVVVLDDAAAEVAGLRWWGVGDPRFTPDKDQAVGKDVEREQIEAFAPRVAESIGGALPVDVVVVHDPRAAAELGGRVPLVLSGHTHEPAERRIGDTLQLVEGSTGGAGLRGLQGEFPEPLTSTVLYFDRDRRRLVAYDRVTVRGLGEAGARVVRHLVAADEGG